MTTYTKTLNVSVNKRFYATKRVKTIKEIIKRIVPRLKPLTVKDNILLALSSFKTSINFLFKGLSNLQKLILKNPIFGPIFIIAKNIVLPLFFLYYIFKKLRWLRFFFWIGSLIVANNFDFITINFDSIVAASVSIYYLIINNIFTVQIMIKDFIYNVLDFVFKKFYETKGKVDVEINKTKDIANKTQYEIKKSRSETEVYNKSQYKQDTNPQMQHKIKPRFRPFVLDDTSIDDRPFYKKNLCCSIFSCCWMLRWRSLWRY